VLALSAAACFSDPTSSLRGGPARLEFSDVQATTVGTSVKNLVMTGTRDTVTLNIRVLDGQGNALAFTIDPVAGYASTAPTIVGIQAYPDTAARTVPGNTSTRAIVYGLAPGVGYARISAAGLTDSIWVAKLPSTFLGTVTPAAAANEGDTIVVAAPAGVTFDPANTAATLGGVAAYIKSISTTKVVLYAGALGASQTLTLTHMFFQGTIPLASLSAPTAITVGAASSEPANDAIATAPVVALPTTVGSYVEIVGSLDAADADDIYTITTTTADSLEFQFLWPDASTDIDGLVLNAAGSACVPANCPAAGSADPEIEKVRLTAATTYKIDINLFAKGTGTFPMVYRIRIYKRG
jgi:hypothetical protein